uniref:Uncharacterized protein n=1 Tax=Paramoeba aestuarina TaxID=180227 RepID=A0A7S4N698_9EUKA|mmetsp:Transcript_1151/g.1835  ORF Transcript_1151/g.1835 Transcript_1151/m.1835 type:complete len:104 (+) Transcript_1151:1-312(+)
MLVALPNVFCFGYDFKTTNTPKEARPFIPNIEDKDMNLLFKNFTSDILSRAIICVTTTTIENEELYLNYRYNPRNKYPDWYVEPNPDEAKRRWGPIRMFYPLK